MFPQAAEEIETLRDQQLRERNQMIKNNVQKMYQELVHKGNHNGFSFRSLRSVCFWDYLPILTGISSVLPRR